MYELAGVLTASGRKQRGTQLLKKAFSLSLSAKNLYQAKTFLASLLMNALYEADINSASNLLKTHTGRSSQYVSNDFRRLIRKWLRQSMSGKGNCYGNAQAESFFSRFKTEIDERVFGSLEEAQSAAFDYIDCYYNRIRRHSTLGCTIPKFEQRLREQPLPLRP